jgi:hypothetical protein
MLTAFNYYEPEEENRIRKGIKESDSFGKEIEIAKKFSYAHPSNGIIKECPVCGGNHIGGFYEKWGVQYLRCQKCYSVFADVAEDDVYRYIDNPELVGIRTNTEYQDKNTESRQSRWEEQLDWLRFRTFRYFGKNKGFSVIDYGSRWNGWIDMLQESGFCREYELRKSILEKETDRVESADIVLALDYMQTEIKPMDFFKLVYGRLKTDGLFIISTKVGSGFDILTLRGNNRNVFPYEHVMLPSKEGIKSLLSQTGFELLEMTTPGTFDVNFVRDNVDGLAQDDYFMRYLLTTATPSDEAEFQRFIQKAGLSSYAQVIAKKV